MTARRRAHDVRHWAVPVAVARRHAAEWREDAACRDHPVLKPHTWDDTAPGEGAGSNFSRHRTARVATATAVCRTACPVAAQCWADVDLEFDDGVRTVDLREVRAAWRYWAADQEEAS